MKKSIKYIVHYVDYETKLHTKTFQILSSAVEFLKDRRKSLCYEFERNGMQFSDGEKITESLLKWSLDKCYIEQQTVTTEILDF